MTYSLNIKNKVNKIKNHWKSKISLLLENDSLIEKQESNKLLLEKVLLLEGLVCEVLYYVLEDKNKINKVDLLQINKLNELTNYVHNIKNSKKTIVNNMSNDNNSSISSMDSSDDF